MQDNRSIDPNDNLKILDKTANGPMGLNGSKVIG